MTTANGPAFWDSLLGPTSGQYPEYVSTDIFFGEYVALLEQDNSSESNGKASSPGSSPLYHQLLLWMLTQKSSFHMLAIDSRCDIRNPSEVSAAKGQDTGGKLAIVQG